MVPGLRRELGAYYTPVDLAERLVGLAFAHSGLGEGELPGVVCDPSCGAGSILLSLADELLTRGASPSEVLSERLLGFDVDPIAVGAARSALSAWAVEHGAQDPPEPRITVLDALGPPHAMGEFDVVVGNPPFASPLRTPTGTPEKPARARVGAYTDDSALHLLAALGIAAPGGVVCLLQPQSVLGSRDAEPIRRGVERSARLVALWASARDLFDDVSVRVCAPVLRRHSADGSPGSPDDAVGSVPEQPAEPASGVAVHWEDDPPRSVDRGGTSSWSTLVARTRGTPLVDTRSIRLGGERTDVTGAVAHCTAGFREEFYALTSVARESSMEELSDVTGPPVDGAFADPADLPEKADLPDRPDATGPAERTYRLITSGMIDPGRLRWGSGSWRLAGERYRAPLAEAAQLQEASPRVARWSAARAVPKVLVASQTKVLEAAVDRSGSCVPVTPVVSVEPTGGCSPAALAAMLSAPSNAALLVASATGTGLSAGSVRVSASAVARLPISTDPRRWIEAEAIWESFEAAARAASGPSAWFDLGARLEELVGFEVREEILTWWVARLAVRI